MTPPTPVALSQAWAPCAHTFVLCSLCQLLLFRWGNGLRAVGCFVRGCSPGVAKSRTRLSDLTHDVTWHGVKECCTQRSQLLRIRSLVSPSCRGDARQKSRNEWSGERGSFKCSLLDSFTWGSGYPQGSHAQHPKGMSVIQKKPQEQKTA